MKVRHYKMVGNIKSMHIPQFYRIYANKYETMKYGGIVNLKNNFISTAYMSSQERKKSITYFLYWIIHTLMQKKRRATGSIGKTSGGLQRRKTKS